jgi:hypothetical protein
MDLLFLFSAFLIVAALTLAAYSGYLLGCWSSVVK